MKLTVLFFVWVILLPEIFAQNTPNALNYKAVAYNSHSEIARNTQIVVEVSVYDSVSETSPLYKEIHYTETNAIGEFRIEIGNGISVEGSQNSNFNQIDWFSQNKFIKIRIDSGTEQFINGLTDTDSFKILSVPYAFYSANSKVADSLSLPLKINLSEMADVNINSPLDNQIIAWDNNSQKWIAADPTGDAGVFIRTDGTSDLSADWNILNNNITLVNGNIKANSVSANSGVSVTDFSDDIFLADSSSLSLVTEKAVKTYVDNKFINLPWTQTAEFIYTDLGKKIGVGVTAPEHFFEVNSASSGGIFFGGNFSGTIPDLGQGTRMTFYPANASFRAGQINLQTDYWNSANVGDYSAAFGIDTKASGNSSFVAGNNNVAVATGSVSFGKDNASNSLYSFSAGNSNTVTGISGTTLGTSNFAHGDYSAVFGNACRSGSVAGVGGDYSFVFGNLSNVEGNYSFSGGYQNNALGNYSFVGGQNSLSSINGISSFAFGNGVQSKANYSFVAGLGNIANTLTEAVFGRYNFSTGNSYSTWVSTESLFSLGNGTDDANRSNALLVLKNGNTGIGLGQNSPTHMLEVGISGDGSTAVANAWNLHSDLNLKKDLRKIENASQKLFSLNGYYFYWKNEADTSRQIGVVAQEVEKVFPELVETDKKGIKSVNYSAMAAVFTEVLKEQNAETESLKSENEKLRTENEALQKRISDFESRLEFIEEYIKASSSANIIKDGQD